MAQKKSQARPSAKLASNKSGKQASASARQSAEKVVKFGNAAVNNFLASSADEAQKAQEKLFSISRESAESLAKSGDTVSKMMSESIAASRDNIETCIECGNITAALAKELSSELFESANRAFSDNVEMTKELFACRTINDMVEISNRNLRQIFDNLYSQGTKISGLVFEYASEAAEPVNDRMAEASKKIGKVLSA